MNAAPSASRLTRRQLLIGAAALAATTLLDACSDGQSGVATPTLALLPSSPSPSVTIATETPVPAATVESPTALPTVRPSPRPPATPGAAPLPTSTLATATPDPDPTFARLADQVRSAMRRYQVPGVAVGLIYEGKEHTAGFGITNVEHPVVVDADTLFLVGSLSKTYTGTALMRLMEQGRLDLHAPIRTYLPNLRLADEETATKVTLAHLVTHSGGWYGDFFADTGDGDDALATYVGRFPELPQLAPLGYLFNYSNAGMSLAGRVIEVVTGKPFETAMADLLLKPLRAQSTFYFLEEVITRGFAVGHTIRAGEPQVVRPYTFPRALHPAAGVIASVKNVLDFARFHLEDGTTLYGDRLLAPATLTQMHTRLASSLPSEDGVAVNWLLDRIGDTSFIFHDGAMPGQDSFMLLCPARQFALVILTNADTGNALYSTIVAWARQTYLGLTRPPLHVTGRTTDVLTSYVGRYSVPGRFAYDVSVDGAYTGPVLSRFGFYDTDQAEVVAGTGQGALLDFPRTPEGEIGWFRRASRVYKRES